MKRALLVIDIQNEYFTGKLPVTYPENSFENIIKVMDFANENNIPLYNTHSAFTLKKIQLRLKKELMNIKSIKKY